MGQYYLIVNLDKKQFQHPHKRGDGFKSENDKKRLLFREPGG